MYFVSPMQLTMTHQTLREQAQSNIERVAFAARNAALHARCVTRVTRSCYSNAMQLARLLRVTPLQRRLQHTASNGDILPQTRRTLKGSNAFGMRHLRGKLSRFVRRRCTP
jgi:hypothetical protein